MKPTLYKVGELYSPNKTAWAEGVDFNFRSGQYELRIMMRSPAPVEIANYKNGYSRFALYVKDDILMLCFKFGDQPWSDGSYSYHLVPEDERIPPEELNKGHMILLTVFLIDAENGILKAIRVVTLSEKFSQRLVKEINEQIKRGWPGDEEYNNQLDYLLQNYSSEELSKRHAVVRCRGGEE